MGNHRFRLSDMMPNAWFYKLKDMSSRSHGAQHSMRRSHQSRTAAAAAPYKLSPSSHPPPTSCQTFIPNRASYYFPRGSETEKFPISPRTQDTHPPVDCPGPNRRSRRKPANPSTKLVSSSVSSGCSCRAWEPESMAEHEAEYLTNGPGMPTIPDLEGRASSAGEVERLEGFDLVSELELPRIITKPVQSKLDGKAEKAGRRSPSRRYPHRVRVRGRSPRIVGNKKTNNSAAVKRSTAGMSESFAVVKRSSDPQRDFRESMVEMIVENNILTSRDLEELLACYLTLNSSEYHDVIVKVFEQIWFDLTDIIKL